MRTRITELGCKEVINVCDGTRYGYVNDVEVDCETGRVISLILHPKGALLAFFSKNSDIVIPWEGIKKIGDDIILVDCVVEFPCVNKKRSFF